MDSFYQFSFEQLQALLTQQGLKSNEARLLFNWYYKKNQQKACSLFGVSKSTHQFLEKLNFDRPQIHTIQESDDKTVKFSLSLLDGKKIETVLIPFNKKYTICLSSQVGCAMNCAFCFTGKQGFTRHLKTEEIIGQFLVAQSWLSQHRPQDDRILNVVFMGQGEPLHNFDAVSEAVRIMISQYGLSLGDHKITISTSGYLPGLLRWKEEMPKVNIALSLHSLDNKKRSQIIPVNRKYPLEDIIPLVESFPEGKKRFVTYEYLLISEFNDSDEEAQLLGQTLQGTKAFINLIPFNPFPGSEFKRPTNQRIQSFFEIVKKFDVPVTLRTTKGDEILAACGQLNSLNRSSIEN